MNELFKITSYLFLALIVSWIGVKIESSFLKTFSDNFIPLLAAILAINVASVSLLVGSMVQVQKETGASLEKTIKDLKQSFLIQLLLIAVSFVALLIKGSKKIEFCFGQFYLELVCNTIVLAVFIYYLDMVVDLGKALFTIVEFNNKNKK